MWLTGGVIRVGDASLEAVGNLPDQMLFVVVIGGSFLIASSRGVKWNKFFAANAAIMLFYLYFLISVSWSSDPAGSFKRVTKDFGMLFVIGLIFSERDPLEAMRAVYVRCAFVLFPVSVVLIKYFPEYARSYTVAGDIMITGVTPQKNSLGEIVLIFTLFLVWDYLETNRPGTKMSLNRIPWDRVILVLMGAWLLHLSQSKTALLCTLIGAFLIVRSGWLASKTINRAVFAGALSLPILMFFSQQFSSVIAPVVEALGRNMTFTGRTDIWAHITSKTVNPLIGAGFWNFWGSRDGHAIGLAMNTPVPNAHCGYVDMYLDGGIVGLIILFFLLAACGRRIVKKLKPKVDVNRYQRARFAFFVVAIIYNLSESTFGRIGPIWFTTLLMIVDFPSTKPVARKLRHTIAGNDEPVVPRRSLSFASQ
jgi:exopolysaccharide production protein ExoQ